MPNTHWGEKQTRPHPVNSLHFWMPNTLLLGFFDKLSLSIAYISGCLTPLSWMHQSANTPVNSLHFWMPNTPPSYPMFHLLPVNSLHFWMPNTEAAVYSHVFGPVNSLHFWMPNTPIVCNHLGMNEKGHDLHTRGLALYSHSRRNWL